MQTTQTTEKKIFIEPEHSLTQRTEFQQRNHQIIRLDGKNCFVEVMTGQFHKGKVILNFEQYDDTKPKGQRTVSKITYYMPFEKFMQISQDVKSGKLAKLAEKEKSANKYPNPVYTDLTGTSNELLKKNNQARPDGKSESRQLKIIPGLKADFMLQAEKGPGEKNETGIIKPLYGNKPEHKVAIPMSGDDFKKFVLLTEANILGYISSQYGVRALKIAEEREDLNIFESLSRIEQVDVLNKKIDDLNDKVDSIEKSLKKISNMVLRIGEIVSGK